MMEVKIKMEYNGLTLSTEFFLVENKCPPISIVGAATVVSFDLLVPDADVAVVGHSQILANTYATATTTAPICKITYEL